MKSIHAQNFQCHEDTFVELHPGVNGFVGDNDSGKSALIRAIRLVLENKPAGDKFRSRWGGDTSVVIDTGDDVIERLKTTKNLYVLNGDPKSGFGTKVPEVVQEALNIDPLSIQRQADRHFLFSESPGEVARLLNRAAGLDQIDRAVSYLKKQKSATDSTIINEKQNIKDARKKIKELSWIDGVEVLVKKAERLDAKRKELGTKIKRLESLINNAEEYQAAVSGFNYIEEAQEKIKLAESYLVRYNETKKQISRLQELLDMHDKLLKKGVIWMNGIATKEKQLNKLMPDQCPLCGLSESNQNDASQLTSDI